MKSVRLKPDTTYMRLSLDPPRLPHPSRPSCSTHPPHLLHPSDLPHRTYLPHPTDLPHPPRVHSYLSAILALAAT
jgi:hypothetical protein